MKRVYSGTGTGANIVWTLQSDARFVYHGWNLMAELEMIPTAADAPRRTLVQAQMPYLRRSYMWGPDMSGTLDGAGGVGGLLAMRRHERGTQSTETFWATHDLNGNVIGLVQLPVTGSQPAKMAVYDYDPSGQLTRVNEPEANFNPIRFSSKYTDSETGLVYYGYRYLSPELGRWISRDPIGEEGGVNLYGMVGNDAVDRWDLLGNEVFFRLTDVEVFAQLADHYSNANGVTPFVRTGTRWNYWMKSKESVMLAAVTLLRQRALKILLEGKSDGYFREGPAHIEIDSESFLLSSVLNGMDYRIEGYAEKVTRNSDGCQCVKFKRLSHDLRDNVIWHPEDHPNPDKYGQMLQDAGESLPGSPFHGFPLHIYNRVKNRVMNRDLRYCHGRDSWDPNTAWPIKNDDFK